MTIEIYRTLSFKTEKQANRNLLDINTYFKSRLISSEILKGTDERGFYGFYIKYILLNN